MEQVLVVLDRVVDGSLLVRVEDPGGSRWRRGDRVRLGRPSDVEWSPLAGPGGGYLRADYEGAV